MTMTKMLYEACAGVLLALVVVGCLLFLKSCLKEMFRLPPFVVPSYRAFLAEGGLRDLLMALGAILAVTLILAPFLPH
jgi:hypothetical protein